MTKKVWPHEFTLIMRLKLAATCEIEFEYYGTEPATLVYDKNWQRIL